MADVPFSSGFDWVRTAARPPPTSTQRSEPALSMIQLKTFMIPSDLRSLRSSSGTRKRCHCFGRLPVGKMVARDSGVVAAEESRGGRVVERREARSSGTPGVPERLYEGYVFDL